jgi:hypothetical protein
MCYKIIFKEIGEFLMARRHANFHYSDIYLINVTCIGKDPAAPLVTMGDPIDPLYWAYYF